MKRYIPLLMILGLALSACTIRFDLDVAINEDESGTFAVFIGFDEEFQQLMEQGGADGLDLTEGLEDVPEGWTAEEVTEDGFEGMRITTDFSDLEELEQRLGELGDAGDAGVGTDFLTDFVLTHEGDEFRFKVDVSGLDEGLTDAVGDTGGEDLLAGFDPESLFEDLFQIRFKLALPGSIGANNADEIDGNTLIWNVDVTDEGRTFEAVSTVGGGSSALLIGAGAVAAAVVAGVGVTAVRRRRKESAVAAVSSAPTSLDAPPVDPID